MLRLYTVYIFQLNLFIAYIYSDYKNAEQNYKSNFLIFQNEFLWNVC